MEAATLSTARSGIFLLFRAYGITFSIGNGQTSRSFIRKPAYVGFRDLSEGALCAGLSNRPVIPLYAIRTALYSAVERRWRLTDAHCTQSRVNCHLINAAFG